MKVIAVNGKVLLANGKAVKPPSAVTTCTDAEDGIVTRTITTYTNNRVQSIGNSALRSFSTLTSVDFPAVTTIGNYAFYGCKALTSVVLRETDTICNLSSIPAFDKTPIKDGTGYIYVPDALVDQYKTATNWSTYAANIKPLSEYTEANNV